MMISSNTQLGLRFTDREIKKELLNLMKNEFENRLTEIKAQKDQLSLRLSQKDQEIKNISDQLLAQGVSEEEIREFSDGFEMKLTQDRSKDIVQRCEAMDIGNQMLKMFQDNDCKQFLITDGVYRPSEMIRIGDNFSSTAFGKIKEGKYSYLMGRHEMCRFFRAQGFLRGFYYDDLNKIWLEFIFDVDDGSHYLSHPELNRIFTKITQLILFIELGDIEVVILEKGKNNGKGKKDGKIHNSSNYTVYVVDSSWNQLIIRTEGFAVRGHFRLQPCGEGNRDRKLIFVHAFEKHGYTRRPKAEIIN